MERTIILPVGLSILRGLENLGVRLKPEFEAAQLSDAELSRFDKELDYLSAELSTLKGLGADDGDEAVFLATNTEKGQIAARANARVAESHFRSKSHIIQVESLVLDNAQEFKSAGIPKLIELLESSVEKAMQQRRRPFVSISGGIKPVVPYITLYGMLRHVPVVYMFEQERDLITLPPLPIGFDWDDLRVMESVLKEIVRDVAVDRVSVKKRLGDHFQRLEGLFQDFGDDQITLSPFGLIILNDLDTARQHPVMLSPTAAKSLEKLNDVEKKMIEILLDRVRSPLWRAQKHHTFHGTDLGVYKPGNTGHRIAGWPEGEKMFIAEVYTSHKEYERDLAGRYRKNYNPAEFSPFWPLSRSEGIRVEEEAGDEIIAAAIHARSLAEQEKIQYMSDRDEALRLAAETEVHLRRAEVERDKAIVARDESIKKTEEIHRRLEETVNEVNSLRERWHEMNSWGIWKRLLWVLGAGR